MAKIIQLTSIPSSSVSTANTTQYCSFYGQYGFNSTESGMQVPVYTAGIFSNLRIRLTANSVAVASTFTIRNGGVDGNQVVSCTASTTGLFVDTTHTDTVAVNDLMSIKSVPGAATGTYSASIWAVTYDTATSTTNTITRMVYGSSGGNTNTTAASTTYFPPLYGGMASGANNIYTVEVNAQTLIRVAGTFKNMSMRLSVNSRATNSTLRFRKNTANGNQVATITASTTGIFLDSVNTDTVAVNDVVGYSFTTGTGTSAQTIHYYASEYQTTTDPGTAIYSTAYATDSPVHFLKSVIVYYAIAGALDQNTTAESNGQVTALDTYTFSNLSTYISSNGITRVSTLMFRVNTADSVLTVPITASTTGRYTDTTHTVTVASTNLLNISLSTGTNGTGFLTTDSISMFGSLAGTAGGGPSPITCTVTAKTVTNKFITKA